MGQHRHFLTIQSRGTVALPIDLRRRHHLDEPGAQIELVEREDGVIELRPTLPIAADQRWFWEARWQERELEVDAHVTAGEVKIHASPKDFLAHLKDLES